MIIMNYCTPKNDVSKAKEFKKICLRMIGNMESLIRENIGKELVKAKWTGREYHIQDNADVAHKDVKMYCDTNQFLALPYCVPHPKPHGARGLSKHYHLRFDTTG